MMNVTYGIISREILTLDSNVQMTYGIVAYAIADESNTAVVVASVYDITTDKQALANLVFIWNQLKLSTIHLHDVIEDFLAS